jgi:hypothetical protein
LRVCFNFEASSSKGGKILISDLQSLGRIELTSTITENIFKYFWKLTKVSWVSLQHFKLNSASQLFHQLWTIIGQIYFYPPLFDFFSFLADKNLSSIHGPAHKIFAFNFSLRTKSYVRIFIHLIIFLKYGQVKIYFGFKISNHFRTIHKSWRKSSDHLVQILWKFLAAIGHKVSYRKNIFRGLHQSKFYFMARRRSLDQLKIFFRIIVKINILSSSQWPAHVGFTLNFGSRTKLF